MPRWMAICLVIKQTKTNLRSKIGCRTDELTHKQITHLADNTAQSVTIISLV